MADMNPEATQLHDQIMKLLKSTSDTDKDRGMELIASLDEGEVALQVRAEITELDLSEWDSLEHVDALSKLTHLEYLRLCDCESLENIDGLAGLTSIERLFLEGCGALENVDALSGLVNLHELWLEECESLENVNGLASLENLDWLNLIGCPNLPTEWQTIFDTHEACANLRSKLPYPTQH